MCVLIIHFLSIRALDFFLDVAEKLPLRTLRIALRKLEENRWYI